MSFNRPPPRRDGSPSTSGGQAHDPSLKLPPLIRDRPLPNPQPLGAARTMHQIQLEMEYDAAESDDSDRPPIQGWPAGIRRPPGHLPLQEIDDLAMREIHALCVFDSLMMSPSVQPRSPLIDALGRAPARRRWGRWRWRAPPTLTNVRVVEAIMMYERGIERGTDLRCSRCRAGQGMSPQCVVMPDELREGREQGPCSNCLYDDTAGNCNAFGRRTPVLGERERGFSPMGDPDRVVDHMAVLEMIAQLKRPSGTRRDHSMPARARRIETAALHIAQAAREWGEKLAKEG